LQFLLAICSFILLDIVREKSVLRFSFPLKVFEAHEGQKLQKWPIFSSSSSVHCISWTLNLQGFGCSRPPFRWKLCLDFDLLRFCPSAATCSDLLCFAYRLYLFFPLSPTFLNFCFLRLSILLDPATLTPGSCSGHGVVCKVDFRTACLTAYLILWTLAVRGRTLQAPSLYFVKRRLCPYCSSLELLEIGSCCPCSWFLSFPVLQALFSEIMSRKFTSVQIPCTTAKKNSVVMEWASSICNFCRQ
jgi:hypothetical protein